TDRAGAPGRVRQGRRLPAGAARRGAAGAAPRRDGTDPRLPARPVHVRGDRTDQGQGDERLPMTATGTRAGSPLHTGDPRFGAPREVDVLIPTRDRAAELAVTLTGLAAQEGVPDFGVAVSDQSEGDPAWATPAVAAAVRILRHRGRPVLLERHLPARGLAEQRAFLLGLSQARYVLSLDDDVWLEPGT